MFLLTFSHLSWLNTLWIVAKLWLISIVPKFLTFFFYQCSGAFMEGHISRSFHFTISEVFSERAPFVSRIKVFLRCHGGVKIMGFEIRHTVIWILAQLPACFVILGKWLILLASQFSCLFSEDDNFYIIGLLWELNEIVDTKLLVYRKY